MNFKNVQSYQDLHDFNYVTFLNQDSIDLKLDSFLRKSGLEKYKSISIIISKKILTLVSS